MLLHAVQLVLLHEQVLLLLQVQLVVPLHVVGQHAPLGIPLAVASILLLLLPRPLFFF